MKLEGSGEWIIDVSVNYGGSDMSFHPLPYLMSGDVSVEDGKGKVVQYFTS